MMGTGQFAVPTFLRLIDSDHEVAALITRPTPPARGRQKIAVNPLREAAAAHGLPVFDPDDVNSAAAAVVLAELRAELFVVCDYGQILSKPTLSLAELGGINLHGSLLPKYRGAAPVQWALYHGESHTGVTVIHMSPRLDAGPCLARRETPIDPVETTVELEPRLARLGVDPVFEAIEILADWDRQSPIGQPQDRTQATRAPRLQKSDGQVNWTRTAEQISNQVRAFKPWPGTFTHWLRPNAEPIRLILERISVVAEKPFGVTAPGTAVRSDGKQLWIATGEGNVSVDEIQPAGKRCMKIDEFLHGHAVTVGETFL